MFKSIKIIRISKILLKNIHKSLIGYRRVTLEINSKHRICRKFAEKCGFLLETILRKYKIIDNKNCDTALYAILNSDFDDLNYQLKYKKMINFETKAKKMSLFSINVFNETKKDLNGNEIKENTERNETNANKKKKNKKSKKN